MKKRVFKMNIKLNICLLFLCFISLLSSCSSNKSVSSNNPAKIDSRTQNNFSFENSAVTAGSKSNVTEHRILIPEIGVTEKILPLEIKFPQEALKLESTVSRMEFDGEIKPIELKLAELAVKVDGAIKPLEVRPSDKPFKVEGTILPDKLEFGLRDSTHTLNVVIPDKLPTLSVNLNGLSQISSGGNGYPPVGISNFGGEIKEIRLILEKIENHLNSTPPPSSSKNGNLSVDTSDFLNSLKDLQSILGEIKENGDTQSSLNKNLPSILDKLSNIDSSLSSLGINTLSIELRVIIILFLVTFSGCMGGYIRFSTEEETNKIGDIQLEKQKNEFEELMLELWCSLNFFIANSNIPARAKEDILKCMGKIRDKNISWREKAIELEENIFKIKDDENNKSYINILKKINYIWLKGSFIQNQNLMSSSYCSQKVRILQGIAAAMMVPGLMFLSFNDDKLNRISQYLFDCVGFVSVCFIAAMIGAPFIDFIIKQANDLMKRNENLIAKFHTVMPSDKAH
jgi:hypothetical protein